VRGGGEWPAEPAPGDVATSRPRTPRDLAAAKLRTALQERSGYVVVTGDEADAAEALFADVEPSLRTYRTLCVGGPRLDPDELVRALSGDGAPPRPTRLAMRALVDEARLAGKPIVVAIADADRADAAALERARTVLEGAPDAGEIVRVALLGGPLLVELLRRPEARGVAMRIGATVRVPARELIAVQPPAPPRLGRTWGVAVGAFVAAAVAVPWLARRALDGERAPIPSVAPEPAAAPEPAIDAGAFAATPPPTEPAAPPMPVVDVAAAPEPPPPAPPVVAPQAPEAPETPAPVATAPVPSGPALQLGAFVRADAAEALRRTLAARWPNVYVSASARDGVTYHRVRIGGFASPHDRDATAAALRAAGYSAVPVRE
jgi:cell division septation protein DedD